MTDDAMNPALQFSNAQASQVGRAAVQSLLLNAARGALSGCSEPVRVQFTLLKRLGWETGLEPRFPAWEIDHRL
jgi:hypothetical protein